MTVLQEDTAGVCIAKESMWTLDDGELCITLTKAKKAETWPSVFKGHQAMDPLAQSSVQKQMLLERFQEENPGFDFRDAQINGQVPDPRTFMGGPGGPT